MAEMAPCSFCRSVALGVFPGLMSSFLIASAYFEIAAASVWNDALTSDGALAARLLKYVFRACAFCDEPLEASACPSLDAVFAKLRQFLETVPVPLPELPEDEPPEE